MERPSRAGDASGRNNRDFDALSRNNEIVSFTKKAVYRMSLWLVNMREKFDTVPFFWSAHYDVGINYVGHASAWDRIEIEGTFDERKNPRSG
ncbi:MAG TPA: hypothetical protein VGQ19_19190 [Burkholderiales bacterium]|jgi:hypothetical protein|nr:hypothetical protein [Burkholderiales bacterium]